MCLCTLFLQFMLAAGKKKTRRGGREAEEKSKIPRCIDRHRLAASPQRFVFVIDHAADGVHIHFGSLYNSFSFFLTGDCCEIKLLITKNTINLFLRGA